MDSIERNFTEALRNAMDEYVARRRDRVAGVVKSAVDSISTLRRRGERTWLTVEETVAYLGLKSRMALYQAVRRGTVTAHRLGRRLRFRRSELDEMLGRG
jgi:excisionase family DNA binding protein